MPPVPGGRLVVDGLWRCLCPSVDAVALLRVVRRSKGFDIPASQSGRRCVTGPRSVHRPRHVCTASTSVAAILPPVPHGAANRSGRTTIRCIHSGAEERVGRLNVLQKGGGGGNGVVGAGTAKEQAWVANHTLLQSSSRSGSGSGSTAAEQMPWVQSLLRARPPYQNALDAAPTSAIYAALRRLHDAPEALDRIQTFARYLLDKRHEKPTAALCETLVRANCHTSGSADAVRDVLRLLQEAKVDATPSLYHAALAVLAVHPDYMLRNAVLKDMQARWIELTPEGQQSVAVGLLRDGQYERALDQLEALATAGPGFAPSWLLDIFIYVLAQNGFVDDALRIVNHRLLQPPPLPAPPPRHQQKLHDGSGDGGNASIGGGGVSGGGGGVSPNVWWFLLDTCCRRGHYAGLAYVWRRAVRPGRLAPSDAMALDVLTLAARRGNAALAAEVLQLLAARGTKLGLPHFEAVLDAYANAGAVDKALQALCIMQDAGVVPDPGSTRSLYVRLTQQRGGGGRQKNGRQEGKTPAAVISGAVHALFDLRNKYGGVPLAAFNVVLEAMLAFTPDGSEVQKEPQQHQQQQQQRNEQHDDNDTSAGVGVGAALDLYRHVRQLCPAGPNRATFRLLAARCTTPQHLHFLASEMRAFGFSPEGDLVDRLVCAHAQSGSLDVALRYVYDLLGVPEGATEADGPVSFDDPVMADEGSTTTSQPPLRTWISRSTTAALVRRCVDEEDPRLWEVIAAGRARGRPMDGVLREVLRDRPAQAGRTAYGEPRAVDLGDDDDAPSEASVAS
ncbi:bar domain containing protein [Niveomyces insectorum RCEF 264]|uniref:Bar domain containing protein n=1 Tax=Niveomyces insectorum RCEF 264 TaxID=1081102 RepID=A0A167VFL1_9HYPO|nr:bar domain containing protein [Niveomyces insectorum RCEF 264]